MSDTPNFRALCAELVDQLSAYDRCDDVEEVSQHWNYTNCNELLHRACIALATPPPEPPGSPTDEELLAMRSWSSHSHTFDSDLVDFARAALERWGHG